MSELFAVVGAGVIGILAVIGLFTIVAACVEKWF